jgi:hypothetical protein
LQGGVERAFAEREDVAGEFADTLGDAVSVAGSGEEGFEGEQVHGSCWQFMVVQFDASHRATREVCGILDGLVKNSTFFRIDERSPVGVALVWAEEETDNQCST